MRKGESRFFRMSDVFEIKANRIGNREENDCDNRDCKEGKIYNVLYEESNEPNTQKYAPKYNQTPYRSPNRFFIKRIPFYK